MTPWFRLYTEVLADCKIGKICQMTKQPHVVILGFWVTLLCRANDSPERGTLLIAEGCPVTVGDLAMQCGLDIDTAVTILEQFKALCMIAQDAGVYHVTNWEKRQFYSDVSTDRVRRHRAASVDESGTPLPKRCGIAPEQNRTDTETESESEGGPSSASPRKKEACPKEWMTALYELCAIDPAMASPGYRRRISQCGIALIKSNAQPADIDRFRGWWFENDWRGKRGDSPTPEQVRDSWGKMNGSVKSQGQSVQSKIQAAIEISRRHDEERAQK